MSHVTKTTSERKSVNSVIRIADGTAAKSRSSSVKSAPPSARRAPTPGASKAVVAWEPALQDPSPVPDGVAESPSGRFLGFVQCSLAVRSIYASDGSEGAFARPVLRVWCADGDGRILVTDPATNTALPRVAAGTAAGHRTSAESSKMILGKYLDTFVTALTRGGENVWAGYSDGSLRVFSICSVREVLEHLRRHQSMITSLVTIDAPADYGARVEIVLSASQDFTLHAYDAVSLAFLFQISTPGSCVRSVVSDGDFVYGGCDDGFIRCWSLTSRGEVKLPGVYPLHAYQEGGVKSVQLYNNALYCAGGRCASMWDVSTGDLIAVFHIPAVMCVKATVVEANFTLWVSGNDGVVYIFDLLDFVLINSIDVHCASLVKGADVINRAPLLEVSLTLEDQIIFASCQSGRLSANAVVSSSERQELLEKELDIARAKIHLGRVSLRRQAATLRSFECLLKKLQHRATEASDGARRRAQENNQTRSLIVQKQTELNLRVMRAIANLLAEECVQSSLHAVMRKWRDYAAEASHQRNNKKMSTLLLCDAQETLQGACVRKAIRAQEKRGHRNALVTVISDFSRRTARGCLMKFFHTWKSFGPRNKLVAKQQDVAVLLEKSCNAARIQRSMVPWVVARSERRAERFEIREQYASEQHAACLRAIFDEHQTLSMQREDDWKQKHDALANFLKSFSNQVLAHHAFSHWLTYCRARNLGARSAVLADVTRDTERLRGDMATLQDNEDLTEAALDDDIAKAEAELARIEAATKRCERVTLQLKDVEDELQSFAPEWTPYASSDSATQATGNQSATAAIEGQTKKVVDVALCDDIMRLLTETGINCRSHWDIITDAHKSASAKPVNTFMKCLEQAKSDFTHAFANPALGGSNPAGSASASLSRTTSIRREPPSPRASIVAGSISSPLHVTSANNATGANSLPPGAWPVDAAAIDKATRIALKRTAVSLRQAVVAWHLLRCKLQPNHKLKNIEELTANAKLWSYVLAKERQLEDAAIEKDPRLPWGGPAAAATSSLRLLPTASRRSSAVMGAAPNAEAPPTPRGTQPRQMRTLSVTPSSTPRAGSPAAQTSTTLRARSPIVAAPAAKRSLATPAAASPGGVRYPMAHRVGTVKPSPKLTPAQHRSSTPTASTKPRAAALSSSTPRRQVTQTANLDASPPSRVRGATPPPTRGAASSDAGSPPPVDATARRSTVRAASASATRSSLGRSGATPMRQIGSR